VLDEDYADLIEAILGEISCVEQYISCSVSVPLSRSITKNWYPAEATSPGSKVAMKMISIFFTVNNG
jgi:hypothetical protein